MTTPNPLAALTLALAATATCAAQQIDPANLNRDFEAQVNTVSEFAGRFNGKPGTPAADREKAILALFDYQMDHQSLDSAAFRRRVADFARTAARSTARMAANADRLVAEVACRASVNGASRTLRLLLTRERLASGSNRWAVADIGGLFAAKADTAARRALNPIMHEMHFMDLGRDLQPAHAAQYRAAAARLDPLTAALTMTADGKLTIGQTESVTFHCLDFPGWAFTISQRTRRGANSGWLITSLTPLTGKDKDQYIHKLLSR